MTIKINNNETKEINCSEIIEFTVANVKFKKELFKAENSTINSEAMKFTYKNKLLRVLLENEKYKLYMLENENYNKYSFYIKKDNDTINELIFKKYENEEKKIKTLPYYKQQLFNIGNSENSEHSKVNLNKINYNRNELIDYIKNLNISNSKIYLNKDSIQLNLKIGVYNYFKDHSFYLEGNIDEQMHFSKQFIYGVNTELELIPSIFNKNYGLFIDYGFDLNEYKDQIDVYKPQYVYKDYHIEYRIKNKIRSNLGLRRYFKLNQDFNINISSKIAIVEKYDGHIFVQRDLDKDFTIKQRSFAFSAGVEYKNLMLELSYTSNPSIDASNFILFNLKYKIINKYFKHIN